MTPLLLSTTMTYMETQQELTDLLAENGFERSASDSNVFYNGRSLVLMKAAMPELEFGATVRLVLYPMHPLSDLHQKLQEFAARRPQYAYVRTFTNRP